MSYDTARPYLAVFVIIKKQDKIAFVLRSNTTWMDGYYGLPSGKVEVGETALHAAVREVKEEIGVYIVEKDLKHLLTMHRQNKGDHAPEWIDIIFETTKWQGDPYNAEPSKHSQFAWLDPNNLPKNMVPPVEVAIREISKGMRYAQYGWDEAN